MSRWFTGRSGKPAIVAPLVLPEYQLFVDSCRHGLSVVYPFKSTSIPDPFGWRFGTGWPPSHSAFGRMRSLLGVQDALRLKPQSVLEVAAGGGGLAACLAKAGCSVVVNDLRREEIRATIKEYSSEEGIRLISGNLFDLSPEQTGLFDLVIASEIIEHVAHPLELLVHLREFLTPGGRILLTTPNGSYFRNKLPTLSEIDDFQALESRQFMPDADGHLFLLTPKELVGLATAAGMQVEQLNCWGTPMLSGHCGLRFIAGSAMARIAYSVERFVQQLSEAKRARICTALSAVLSAS